MHGSNSTNSIEGAETAGCMHSTIEGGQLGGVGGDEAGGDASPVAAANDGHPVLVVPVLHLQRAAAGRSELDNADQETNHTAGRPVQRRLQ